MTINYEMLILLLVALVTVSLVMLGNIVKLLNELRDELDHMRDLEFNQYDSTKASIRLAREAIDNLRDIVEIYINCDEKCEDCEWTPEPEPGEVETPGELSIEIDEDPIHLITPNQFFFENNGYHQINLEYASDSDELRFYYFDSMSDEYIVVDNVTECIGEALKFFGVNSKDDRVVYVRNNVFDADFRIVKVG